MRFRYLYCDEISLTADTVLPTLYAAKKYIMPHLARACVEYLETNVDTSNACLLLNQSRLFDEPELMQRCLDVIDSHADDVLQSDSFTDIDYQTLEQILGRDTLGADETTVYAATIRWAEAECTRQGRDTSQQQCREVLGEALYLLRFPTMSLDDFANGVGQSDLLSNRDIIDLFRYLTTKNKPELRFPTTRREGWFKCCLRFGSVQANSWSYQGEADCIEFTVDKTISVVGFGLYGSCNGAAEYLVNIALKCDGALLLQKQQNVAFNGSNNTEHVFFDSPAQIMANIKYTARLDLTNSKRGYQGVNGMSTVTSGNVKFTFTSSLESSNGTGVTQGQIPEILFRC